MKYMLSVTVAVLLTAFSVHSASSQVSTLTNADVIRFVATMRMSEEVVIALINEATAGRATRFDLSPSAVTDLAARGVSPAVIAAMGQPAAPTPPAAAAPPAVAAAPSKSSTGVYTCTSAPLQVRTLEENPGFEVDATGRRAMRSDFSPYSTRAEVANIDQSKLGGVVKAASATRMTEWTAGPQKIDALLFAFEAAHSALCTKTLTRGEKDALERLEKAQSWFKLGFLLMRVPGKSVEGYTHLQEARGQVDFVMSTFILKK